MATQIVPPAGTWDGLSAGPLHGALSPQKSVQLPRDNPFGEPPQRITLSAHGWMVFVPDLPPGVHAIRSYNTFDDGSVYDFTKYVNVVQR